MERCTTARCPECDGKQKILRSSKFSEFSTAGTNLKPDVVAVVVDVWHTLPLSPFYNVLTEPLCAAASQLVEF